MRHLVARMHEPGAPISRNKHFHTFDNPLGRQALEVSRRLKALQQAIAHAGAKPSVRRLEGKKLQVEISFSALRARRTTVIEEAEFELLCQLPGMSVLQGNG